MDASSSTEPTFETTTDPSPSRDDITVSLRLIADSIAQQRQVAARAILSHSKFIGLIFIPLILSSALLLFANAFDIRAPGWSLVLTTWTGFAMAALVHVRTVTEGYIERAESIGLGWWNETCSCACCSSESEGTSVSLSRSGSSTPAPDERQTLQEEQQEQQQQQERGRLFAPLALHHAIALATVTALANAHPPPQAQAQTQAPSDSDSGPAMRTPPTPPSEISTSVSVSTAVSTFPGSGSPTPTASISPSPSPSPPPNPNSNETPRTLLIKTTYNNRPIGILLLKIITCPTEATHRLTTNARVSDRAPIGVIRAWTVEQRYRGCGVGRGLLGTAVRACRARGWAGPVFARDHVHASCFLGGEDGGSGRIGAWMERVVAREMRMREGVAWRVLGEVGCEV
ncbi:uncharacterized protein BO97DRAFT_405879 [Aspergillus homomorphus CBS 101889]|uniref:N-acetyltransferase domain-containing protein n=1 Tax=Aspergillus homomorphus (strain CBS 101889) TaxID=1450537 RepID=A0A395HWN4_ASPHC|nr:hypothetical protein BO97DRAFT_405879 [Aspergillus homomorphus CBS 101889]RAL11835.1 hypothetical protein BO97DRAFT_405879 [Aspergillus homomorphus CBS 101889]